MVSSTSSALIASRTASTASSASAASQPKPRRPAPDPDDLLLHLEGDPNRGDPSSAASPSRRSTSTVSFHSPSRRPWRRWIADLGEPAGAVQREARRVGGEHAAGQLVVARRLRRARPGPPSAPGRRRARAPRDRRRRRAPPRPRRPADRVGRDAGEAEHAAVVVHGDEERPALLQPARPPPAGAAHGSRTSPGARRSRGCRSPRPRRYRPARRVSPAYGLIVAFRPEPSGMLFGPA